MRALPVLAPCHASFEAMEGDARTRHCGKCDRKVHDLSARTKDEALQLLASSEGRVCIRYATDSSGNLRFRATATLAVALSVAACSAVDRETQTTQIGPIAPVPVVDAGNDPELYTVGEYYVEPTARAHCNAGPPRR